MMKQTATAEKENTRYGTGSSISSSQATKKHPPHRACGPHSSGLPLVWVDGELGVWWIGGGWGRRLS